jgi:hypothetical protein
MNLNYFHSYKLPAVITFSLTMLIWSRILSDTRTLGGLGDVYCPIQHFGNGFPDDVSG